MGSPGPSEEMSPTGPGPGPLDQKWESDGGKDWVSCACSYPRGWFCGVRGVVAEQAAVVGVRVPELRTLLDPSLSHATFLTEADVVRTDPQATL